jgi:hypothetical protein
MGAAHMMASTSVGGGRPFQASCSRPLRESGRPRAPAIDRRERRICRWLAYTGSPILLTQVLYTPVHSLIDQSLHSRLGAETTNGDGFGIGWYDAALFPGVFS